MTHRCIARCSFALALALALGTELVVPRAASAADPQQQQQQQQDEARNHFQHAVDLYGEGDYRTALVEFKRAYALVPNTTVLYNLGETYYQLRNYAAALEKFERFLADGGIGHRAEAEHAVALLRPRVGQLDASTIGADWEIAVDDESVGRTPLLRPIAVSIGRRRITATKRGEVPISQWVEIGSGETAVLSFGPSSPPQGRDREPPERVVAPPTVAARHVTPAKRSPLVPIGWMTAAALGIGATVTGILTLSSASRMNDAQRAYPRDVDEISAWRSATKTLALVTDGLVASALLVGGASLYMMLSRSSDGAGPTTRVGVSSSAVVLETAF